MTLLLVLLAGCAAKDVKRIPILDTVPAGELTRIGRLPVLHLNGSPYDMGYQHGSLMRAQVKASVANALSSADRWGWIPFMGKRLARHRLDQAWRQMAPFVPQSFLEEMKGLADGANVSLRSLQQVHALMELAAVSGASSAVFGKGTKDGRLIQIRNFDWAIQSGVQDDAAIFVYHPTGGIPFVTAGWLGFIGAVSGINAHGISIAEIGAKTVDESLKGIPMPFVLRRVLAESDNLDKAVAIVQTAVRTGGYNYLFADAQAKKAVALETTHSRCAVFWVNKEPKNPLSVLVENGMVRSEFALDPAVRDFQVTCRGNPSRFGVESPEGSGAYDIRYRGQGLLIRRFYGTMDPEVAMAIARAIAPRNNIQSVVYAYPQMWVANAEGRRSAADGTYQEIDLEGFLKELE